MNLKREKASKLAGLLVAVFLLGLPGKALATHGGLLSTNTATIDSASMGFVLDPANDRDRLILKGFTQNTAGFMDRNTGLIPFPDDPNKASDNYVPTGDPGAFTNHPDGCVAMVEHRDINDPTKVIGVTLLPDIGDFRTYLGAGAIGPDATGENFASGFDTVNWCIDAVATFSGAALDPQTAPAGGGPNTATGLIESSVPINIQGSAEGVPSIGGMSITGILNFTIDVNPDGNPATTEGVATFYHRIEQTMDLSSKDTAGQIIPESAGSQRTILEQGWANNALTDSATAVVTSGPGQNAFVSGTNDTLIPVGIARNIPWSVDITQDVPQPTSIINAGVYMYDESPIGSYNAGNGGSTAATGSKYPGEQIFDLPGFADQGGIDNFPNPHPTPNIDPQTLLP